MRNILFLALVLSGCATAPGGDWPSLAQRPGETTAGALAAQAPAAGTSTPAPAPSVNSAVVAIANTRLGEVERDLVTVTKRWQQQRGATQAAVSAARGSKPSSEPWSKAQLELSRMEKIGAELSELRERLDAIAGDLAAGAAGGSDVSTPLTATGRLIDRVEALRAEHGQAFDAARKSLQPA